MKLGNFKRVVAISVGVLIMLQVSAFAAPEAQKIAVIDLQKVVSASPQVKALRASRETKNKEIANLVKAAQTEISKQKDNNSKKVVAEKYEKQIKAKKEANNKEYTTKLQAADKSINEQIAKKATELGYTMVLPKASVVFGGDDITDQVIKGIK